MFSRRTEFDLEESDYAAALREAKAGGGVIDLTLSNPTRAGFAFPVQGAAAFVDDVYSPDALGLLTAREAVAAYYADHGVEVEPDRITLTASTSESYSFLFRLLCDPGDEVLVPTPSYPLFDYLAALDNVLLRPYSLFYDHGWQVDLHQLEAAITPRTRAILVVHPNNPTGHFTSEADRGQLYRMVQRNGLALIVDEVFLDYSLGEGEARTFGGPQAEALTFTLSGLSKVCALPQKKVAWIVTSGPANSEAQERLEVIADTFLSVASAPQLAVPGWLARRGEPQRLLKARLRANLAVLDAALEGTDVTRLSVEAGWSVILRIPQLEDDTTFAIWLLKELRVAVHPGSFYGLQGGRLVLSLLPQEEEFREGVNQLLIGIKAVNPASTAT